MTTQLDHLDQIAIEAAHGNTRRMGPLSTGERLYVALAASSSQLLEVESYTIAEALARIGPEWTAALTERWQYRGAPKRLDNT